ncbi:MAG: S26 family signal peptidase [Firmicutes bacterium]|nr:S26 family signal peptidase [Bacillota bacterium]
MGENKFLNQEYSLAQEGRNMKGETKRFRTASIISSGFFTIAILISVGLIAFTVVFFYSEVRGTSMMHRLNPYYFQANAVNGGNNTDSVLVNRFANPSRGDIIVTRFYRTNGQHQSPDGRFCFFIKRVIALPGDTVFFHRIPLTNPTSFANDRFEIQVNGVPIDEYYLDTTRWGQNLVTGHYVRLLNWLEGGNLHANDGFYNTGWQRQFIQYVTHTPANGSPFTRREIVIPQGYVFYMGDNRGGDGSTGENGDRQWKSFDSSDFGPERTNLIVGVVVDVARNQSLPAYMWNWVVHIFTFRWIWG